MSYFVLLLRVCVLLFNDGWKIDNFWVVFVKFFAATRQEDLTLVLTCSWKFCRYAARRPNCGLSVLPPAKCPCLIVHSWQQGYKLCYCLPSSHHHEEVNKLLVGLFHLKSWWGMFGVPKKGHGMVLESFWYRCGVVCKSVPYHCGVVGGGPTYCRINAGWSEIFSDITAGYPKKNKKNAAWWSEKPKSDTPTNFSNGIAFTMLAETIEGWWVFQYCNQIRCKGGIFLSF